MTRARIKVDYLAEPPGGPLVRFAAGPTGVAVLRDAFDQLASGGPVVDIEGMELADLSSIEFGLGARGGLYLAAPGRLVFDGDRAQWETRARLLDPLTQSAEGFQYLGYEGGSELGAVVTTCPDGTF